MINWQGSYLKFQRSYLLGAVITGCIFAEVAFAKSFCSSRVPLWFSVGTYAPHIAPLDCGATESFLILSQIICPSGQVRLSWLFTGSSKINFIVYIPNVKFLQHATKCSDSVNLFSSLCEGIIFYCIKSNARFNFHFLGVRILLFSVFVAISECKTET